VARSPESLGLTGEALHAYQLEGQLGVGPIGRVYSVSSPAVPHPLALKILHPQVAAWREVLASITHAAEIVAKLGHPGLSPILQTEMTGERPFVVMPRDSGESFASRWSRGAAADHAYTPIVALRYVEEVAQALDTLHAAELFHGNIKPSNVRIHQPPPASLHPRHPAQATPAGETDTPGVLRLADSVYGRLVAAHRLVGRHADAGVYAAPEQFDGTLDPQTDQYALAVLAWVWLLGRTPFPPRSSAALLEQKMELEFVERSWAGRAHPAVLAVLLRALRPEPQARFPSVRDFYAALLDGVERATLDDGVRVVEQLREPRVEVGRRQLLVAGVAAICAVGATPLVRPLLLHLDAAAANADFGATTQSAVGPETLPTSYRQSAVLRGHTGVIDALDWAPDGSRLISASSDRTLRFWMPQTGRSTGTLLGHSNYVNDVAWAPNGQQVASASSDATARIWDATGTMLRVLQGHTGDVFGVAWYPDSAKVVTVSADGSLRIWDAATGKPLRVLTMSSQALRSVAVSPDGRLLAVAGQEKLVWLRNASTGELVAELAGSQSEVRAVAFAPNGDLLATAGLDGRLRLWNVLLKSPLGVFPSQGRVLRSVAWSPDGSLVAVAADSDSSGVGQAVVWRLSALQLPSAVVPVNGAARAVRWSPNGGLLAVGTAHGTIQMFERSATSS